MHNPPLILIVDDMPSFLEIFGEKLKGAGFAVETAPNGEEGIKRAKEIQPDLILMDVRMPVMNGTDAVVKLKDDEATRARKCRRSTASLRRSSARWIM